MDHGLGRFALLCALLLPSFLLPPEVQVCLAGWIDCEVCPTHAEDRQGDEAPLAQDEGHGEPSCCCHCGDASSAEQPATLAPPCCAADPVPQHLRLEAPDAACACCLRLCKPDEPPRDEAPRPAETAPPCLAPLVSFERRERPSPSPRAKVAPRPPTPPPLVALRL